MADSLEWLTLAKKCEVMAAQTGDDATLRSLSRLASEYETKAAATEYLSQVYATEALPLQ